MDSERDMTSSSSAAAAALPSALRRSQETLPRGRMVGASLLCYCVDPTWSRVYFLLGKERKNPRWKLGSERWSDFGGRVSSKAVTAEETASKEFVEETLAMVKYFESDTLPRPGWEDIANSLRHGEYTFQLTFGVSYPDHPELTRNYVTFVKQIPWDPQCIARFEQCREMLVTPTSFIGSKAWQQHIERNPALMPNQQARRDFMEKKTLGLWSIPQLRHAVESNGVLARKDGKVERCKAAFVGTIETVLSELAFAHPESMQDG